MDMSLFLKLQKRVKELELEKQSLQDELEKKEDQVLRAKAKVRWKRPRIFWSRGWQQLGSHASDGIPFSRWKVGP